MDNERINLFDAFTLDLARGCLTRNDEPVHLRPQTYEVLKYLVLNSGRLISKDKLIEEVWQGRAVTDGSLVKCIEEVREALGVDARQHVRNVRGRGYIFEPESSNNGKTISVHSEEEFVSFVVEDEIDEEPSTANATSAQVTKTSRATNVGTVTRGTNRKRLVETLLLLFPLLVLPVYLYATRHWSSPAPIESLAVMPFANESGNGELEYLSDGLTDSVISQLARLPRLSVKSRGVVFLYKGKNTDPRQAASELFVQAILSGRLVQHGDDVVVYLSLVDGRTGNEIWGEQYNRKLSNVVALQSELARDVSAKLQLHLTGTETQELTKGITKNNDAYQAYLKGRYYWSRPGGPGFAKSLGYFQQAIDLDPNYAVAYEGMAHYFGYAAATGALPPDEYWPKSETLLKKAMSLDDSEAESYNALAGIQLYYHRDWPAAERSLRHGIDLNPNSAEVHHHFGRCLYLFGRNDEALTELRRSVELEPLSLRYQLSLGIALFVIRDYDRAIEQLRKTIEMEPNYAPAHDRLAYVYEKKGMQREAIAEWSRALVLREQLDQAALVGRTYASSGFEAAVRFLAQQRFQTLNDRAKRGEYVPAIEYVDVYKRMGEKHLAFEWLAKALQERNRFAFEVKVEPFYDDLRNDPRFGELLKRAGLSS